MAPPNLPRAPSPAPQSPKSAASASRRGPRPTVLSLRAPAASPPGYPPARGRARSPRDRPSPRSLAQLLRWHQPDAYGVESGLGAAPHVQLREDAVHVGLDCTLPDIELACDLLVGFAPSQELPDLRLPSGKSL